MSSLVRSFASVVRTVTQPVSHTWACHEHSRSSEYSQGTFSRERSQLLYPRVTTVAPLFINSTPSEVSAIPCVLFGNPLRALFLKNGDFFCYGEIFVPNTRGPLGCLLGFWPRRPKPSGPKPCGGKYTPFRAVFKWPLKNQSNYSDQSQQEQTAWWTNHNS